MKYILILISFLFVLTCTAQTKRLIYEEGSTAGIVEESALKVSMNNLLNIPTVNQILYSNGTNLVSSANFTWNGSTLNVTGTGAFTGTVSGANAASAGQFTTLSQLQSSVSGTVGTIPKFTAVNTIGNSSLTDISSVLTYTGESKATKFTSTGTSSQKSYLKHQIVGLFSENNGDETFLGWGDRDYLKDCALWGDVTVSITGAGNLFSTSREHLNNMFDLGGTSTTIQNLDATSTQIQIFCDLKTNQPNYGSAFVVPYLIYRIPAVSTYTTYKRCVVEVSTDNTTWYTCVDNTNILADYTIAWVSPRVTMAHPSNTFRYVRYTLSDKQGTGSNCEISFLGLRHNNAPIFTSLLTKAGGSMWGDFKLYNEGGISTPTVTLTKTGSATAVNFVSNVATGTQPYATTSTTLNTNLNADLLDGQHGSYYQNATNINAGTLADARLSSNIPLKNAATNVFTGDTYSYGLYSQSKAEIYLNGSTGGINMNIGDASKSGRINFFSPNQGIGGYIGDVQNSGSLTYNATNGNHSFNGNVSATNEINAAQLKATSSATSTTNTQVYTVGTGGILDKQDVKTLPISPQKSTISLANNAASSINIDFENEVSAVKPIEITFGNGSVNSSTITSSNMKNGATYTVYWNSAVFHDVTYSSTYFKKADGSALATCSTCVNHILTFTVINGIAYLTTAIGATSW